MRRRPVSFKIASTPQSRGSEDSDETVPGSSGPRADGDGGIRGLHDAHVLAERPVHNLPNLLSRQQLHDDVLLTEHAMYHRDPPEVRDAYRVWGQQRRREEARDGFMSKRISELVGALTGPVRRPHRVEAGGWCPAGTTSHDIVRDMAFWIEETQDVTDVLCVLCVCDPGTHAELCEQYALARAAWEAGQRNWSEEAAEARAFEMGGM